MARTTRRRHSSGALPEFNESFAIPARRACIDRMVIEVSGLRIAWPEGGPALYDYLQNLSRQSQRIFGAPNRSRDGVRITLKVLQGWLFGGQLTLWPEDQNMRLTLHLNPTRVARHKGFDIPTRFRWKQHLWVGQTQSRSGENQSLDNSDNWLPDDMLRAALRCDWPEFTSRHLGQVVTSIDRCLNSMAEESFRTETGPFRCDRWTQMVVKQAEVYWEAAVDDAVTSASLYGEALMRRAREAGRGSYDIDPHMSNDRINNAESTSLKLANGDLRAALYSKTHRRLRLEMRYLKNVRRHINVSREEAALERGTETLPVFLGALMRDAERRLTPLLNDLILPEPDQVGFHRALSDFLSGVAWCCSNGGYPVYLVLPLLIRHDGITVPLSKRDYLATARQLEDRQIVERARNERRENRTHRYQVRQRFRPVTSALREIDW